MTSGPFLATISIPFCLAAGILHRYANVKKQNRLVTFTVLIALYVSFLTIFAVPVDVSCTLYRRCVSKFIWCNAPPSRTPDNEHISIVAYWAPQILSWLIFPLLLSFSKTGEFTALGKLTSALVDNAIHYGSLLSICGVLIIYVAVAPGLHFDWLTIIAIVTSASNTWGLLLLVGLLGYALVEIPRSLWLSSTPEYRLQRAYFKVAKISVERCTAEDTLDRVVESVLSMSSCVKPLHPLYAEMETIIHKVPPTLLQKHKGQFTAVHDDSMASPTLKSLVQIHKQLIKSLRTSKQCEIQWQSAVQKVILFEDTQHNRHSSMRTFDHTFSDAPALISPSFEWYWRCIIQNYVYQVGAILCGTLSAMVVWTEVTFSIQSPVLSLFAVFLQMYSQEHKPIELMSAVIIVYMCICAIYTVLKIRVFSHFYLAPHHQTNDHSLIFFGMMLCRLAPPVCLNFFGLIHLDSHIHKTQELEPFYIQAMGNVSAFPIISDGLNIYFPMTVLACCLATYFRLGSRLLSQTGFKRILDDDEPTPELVEEGRQLTDCEKRKLLKSKEAANNIKSDLEPNPRTIKSMNNGMLCGVHCANVAEPV